MIKSAIGLKAKVRNISKGDSKTAQAMIRIYFMERFLERISLSEYKNQFVLKGGMLVSSFIGINLRTTMDIDTTVKALPLSKEELEKIILEICEVKDYSRTEYIIQTLFRYDGESSELRMTGELFHTEKMKSYGQYEAYCEAVKTFCEGEE